MFNPPSSPFNRIFSTFTLVTCTWIRLFGAYGESARNLDRQRNNLAQRSANGDFGASAEFRSARSCWKPQQLPEEVRVKLRSPAERSGVPNPRAIKATLISCQNARHGSHRFLHTEQRVPATSTVEAAAPWECALGGKSLECKLSWPYKLILGAAFAVYRSARTTLVLEHKSTCN